MTRYGAAVTILTVLVATCGAVGHAETGQNSVDSAGPLRQRLEQSLGQVGETVGPDVKSFRRGTPAPLGRRTVPEPGVEVKKHLEEGFRVSGQPEVSIKNEFGNLRVRPSDRNEVRMRVEIIARARKADQARQLASEVMIHVNASPERVAIETRHPVVQRSEPVLLQSDYDMEVPARSNLRLENRFGDIEVRGIHGKIDTACSYGQTRVEQVNGELNIASENGSVTGTDIAGRTYVNAQVGQVDLQDVSGPTTVRSRYGSVVVKSASVENDLNISSDSDSVKLILPPQADPTMHVHTTRGKIESEIPLSIQTMGNSSTGRRVSERSRQQIELSNSMGDILVTRDKGAALVPSSPTAAAPVVETEPGFYSSKVQHELEFAPGNRLTIENQRGTVKVTGWNRNAVGLSATKVVSSRDRKVAESYASSIAVRPERIAGGVRISPVVPAAPPGVDMDGGRIDLDVRVPQGADLEIRSGRGDVVIDSVNGKLSVSDGRGNITVMNLKPVQHDWSLRSADGSISVLIPQGSDVEIVAAVKDGSIDSAVPLQGQVGRQDASLRGKVGTGKARVELNAAHGKIVIN